MGNGAFRVTVNEAGTHVCVDTAVAGLSGSALRKPPADWLVCPPIGPEYNLAADWGADRVAAELKSRIRLAILGVLEDIRREADTASPTPEEVAAIVRGEGIGDEGLARHILNDEKAEWRRRNRAADDVVKETDRILNSPEAKAAIMRAEHEALSAGEFDMAGPPEPDAEWGRKANRDEAESAVMLALRNATGGQLGTVRGKAATVQNVLRANAALELAADGAKRGDVGPFVVRSKKTNGKTFLRRNEETRNQDWVMFREEMPLTFPTVGDVAAFLDKYDLTTDDYDIVPLSAVPLADPARALPTNQLEFNAVLEEYNRRHPTGAKGDTTTEEMVDWLASNPT